MKKANGFTIVELIVTITVIGIIAAIGIMSYNRIKVSALDDQRSADSKMVAEALERYYDKTGEYPQCTGAMDQSITSISNDLLVGLSGDALTSPGTSEGTSSVTCQSLSPSGSNDAYSYELSGSTFILKYRSFSENSIEEIRGRRGLVDTSTFQISAGGERGCLLNESKIAYCWGRGDAGQIGNNTNDSSNIPMAVDTTVELNNKRVNYISSGDGQTCAIASDSAIYCWGYNAYGNLGNNGSENSLVPTPVYMSGALYGKTAKTISSGGWHTCIVASDDRAYCWGYNLNGRLGDGFTTNRLAPVAVNTSGLIAGKTVKSISAGDRHTCAITTDGTAYCWGYNGYRQLGDGTTTQRLLPVAVNTSGELGGKTVKAISAGTFHTCAIASDDKAYCWGKNYEGQLGNDSNTDSSVPVAVYTGTLLSGKTIKSISVGDYHTCAIASDNNGYCWGDNSFGQLGDSSSNPRNRPTAISTSPALSGLSLLAISSGDDHNCVVASNHRSYCWGDNDLGQIGSGSTGGSINTPTAVNTTY